MSYEAEITTCVLVKEQINILFRGKDDGEIFEGRFSLDATNGDQTQQASWIYPDSKKEKSPFPETQPESNEKVVEAIVTGKLHNFRGKKVEFVGKWDETASDPEDGEVWDLELEALVA